MCGIAGLFLPRNAPRVRADLMSMLQVMRHRGPDGTGIHRSEDLEFQAAFTRLAIIDLETGGQPLVDQGGRHVFLGNGEIYNYREIRADLVKRGHAFQTSGDMEPALRLYQEQGRGFIEQLNGMFAIALYDRDAHHLLLVRDRLGIKPLYWARIQGGGILFASEIKALLASGLVGADIDDQAVSDYLSQGYVSAPNTLFRHINKLPAGMVMMVEADGAIRQERYWRPHAQPGLAFSHPEQWKEHLSEILRESVALQLRSDVPVGALLSGGIDSGLMVALAAQANSSALKTYTVRFSGADYDETPLARQVSQRYETDHTELELSVETAADLLPALAWYCDEPLFDAALLPNYLINRLLGQETRVVLNGTGGDELFAGYGRYFQLPIEAQYLSLPLALRRQMIEPLLRRVYPMQAWKLARASKFWDDPGGYLADHTTQFPLPLRKILGNTALLRDPPQVAAFRGFAADGLGRQAGSLAADIETYLAEDLLLLLDRSTMANSVEGRVPFLDHRLVEAALAIPDFIRNPGNRPKAIERDMARDLLPPDLLNAPKRGFASPVPAWMSGSLAIPTRRLLTSARALDRGYWSRSGIESLLADPKTHAFRLYSLVMLELTIRLHAEDRLRVAPAATLIEVADG